MKKYNYFRSDNPHFLLEVYDAKTGIFLGYCGIM